MRRKKGNLLFPFFLYNIIEFLTLLESYKVYANCKKDSKSSLLMILASKFKINVSKPIILLFENER